MLVMKFNEPKLHRLIEDATNAHAAVRAISDRVQGARDRKSRMEDQKSSQARTWGRSDRDTARDLAAVLEELPRLEAQRQRAEQRWQQLAAVAQACAQWAAKNSLDWKSQTTARVMA